MPPTVNPAARVNNPKPVAQRRTAQKPPTQKRIQNPQQKVKVAKVSGRNPSSKGKKVNIVA